MSSPASSQSFHSANSQRGSSITTDDSFHSLASSQSNASTVSTVIRRSDHSPVTTSLAPYSITTTSGAEDSSNSSQSGAVSTTSTTSDAYDMGFQSGCVPEWPLGANKPTRPAPLGFNYGGQTATARTTVTLPSTSANSTYAPETYQDNQAMDMRPPQEELFSTYHSGRAFITSTGSTDPCLQDGVVSSPVPPDTPTTKTKKRYCFSTGQNVRLVHCEELEGRMGECDPVAYHSHAYHEMERIKARSKLEI
ncbi:hypothetical protein I307_05322 [Cryptococcus deuterogattii 99/473]|uniref:Unplaced genomic scaffold supercont1.6, whole genome shotgun sequence n=1 Tax=Cryptococcus deuterogattii Ram5 TaxID=1296110 RepID=A0A0D0V2W5_9TREE|nr:hypothetical protein I313_02860 [Cryptococcus deuterogattii Ram5]KIY55305.1 hypothetical protein I307_05322 [Cryptococcus deuterogattii 99/473]